MKSFECAVRGGGAAVVRSIARAAILMPKGVLQLALFAAALASFSCAPSMTPYFNVPRQERLRSLRTVVVAPIMIRSFGLDSGVAFDTTTLPLRLLQQRLRRSFTPVLLPPSAFESTRRAPTLDELTRAAAQLGGVDAIIATELRYISADQDFRAELHLRVIDLADRALIAEIGEEEGRQWSGLWGSGDSPVTAVQTVIELAVRRLEIYRPRHDP